MGVFEGEKGEREMIKIYSNVKRKYFLKCLYQFSGDFSLIADFIVLKILESPLKPFEI